MSAAQVPAIDVDGLPGDAEMVDVRETREWQAGRAPNAVHLPMSELIARIGELPDRDPLYVVCAVGSRSARVVAYLTSEGYPAVNVAGGMRAWQAAGRPLIADGPAPPQIV